MGKMVKTMSSLLLSLFTISTMLPTLIHSFGLGGQQAPSVMMTPRSISLVPTGSDGVPSSIISPPSGRRSLVVCYDNYSKSGDDDVNEENSKPVEGSGSTSTTTKKSMVSQKELSLLRRIDEIGLSLKSIALEASNYKASNASDMTKKDIFLCMLKSCVYYSLYVIYRAYRGFFVILPAVFREVYRKLEDAVDSPFLMVDDKYSDDNTGDNENDDDTNDVNPETGKVRLRTRLTVSVLASVVTFTYVVGGAAGVFLKFLKTITKTSSVTTSFQAAADEVETNEFRVLRITNRHIRDKNNKNGNVNGHGWKGPSKPSSSSSSRLAP